MILNILYFGDVVGRPGRNLLVEQLPALKKNFDVNLTIVNGENSAGGRGVSDISVNELFAAGVDLVSLGDHTYYQAEFDHYLNVNSNKLVRPLNYPSPAPGVGYLSVNVAGVDVVLINLMGRVSMGLLIECPFLAFDQTFLACKPESIKIVDFHAEATSEKYALAHYIDGRCSLLVGTHTHVQTADEQIFPKGMGYITDLGMCGPASGVIGMDAEVALNRFLTARHKSYKLCKSQPMLNGVFASIDSETKRTVKIERIRIVAN
jgi:metallophosphoesterase (TIGR00282 family)